MTHYQFLLVCILVFIVHIGNCLQCYSCNSVSSNLCKDPVNASLLSTVYCNQRNYGCLKQILPAKGNTGKTVNRGCASIAFCEVLESVSDHCSVCSTDLCNLSTHLIPSVAAIVLTSILILVLNKP